MNVLFSSVFRKFVASVLSRPDQVSWICQWSLLGRSYPGGKINYKLYVNYKMYLVNHMPVKSSISSWVSFGSSCYWRTWSFIDVVKLIGIRPFRIFTYYFNICGIHAHVPLSFDSSNSCFLFSSSVWPEVYQFHQNSQRASFSLFSLMFFRFHFDICALLVLCSIPCF